MKKCVRTTRFAILSILCSLSGFAWGNVYTVTNTSDGGAGSLRQAILDANAQAGLDTIAFSIGTGIQTISPTSGFATIISPVVIDGTSQPGWVSAPIIEISGDAIFTATNGLTIKGGGSIVRSIIVNGFWNYGVVIDSLGGTTITGCYIGLAPDGTTAKANFSTGLFVKTGSNQIGGTAAGDGNVISGNMGGGITLTSASATGNLIVGNYIGTDATGTTVRGNSSNGITITSGASGNTIGGTLSAAKNVIAGNSTGISVTGSGTTNNTILGNFIGTDKTGLLDLGNSSNGISITSSASTNTIGGAVSGARNIISGNGTRGILLDGPSTTGNVILGNFIGVDSTGVTSMRNDQDGIIISGQAKGNAIGGTTAGEGNVIAYNGSTGVGLSGTTTTGNKILGNSIYGNTSIGIDLGKNGFTANNGTKSSSLPNYEMDHPVFTSAILSGTTLTFDGYVGSAPSQSTFAGAIVEVFKSDGDTTGYGEGQTYLGRDTCDANGDFSGSFTVAGLGVGDKITGTATDGSNNTSEFGASYTVNEILPIQLSSFTASVVNQNQVRLDWTTLTELNNYGFEVQRSQNIPDGYQTIPNSFVPGHGTTNEPQHYIYIDSTVTPGAWYYRLKQIDLDGAIHHSDGVQVNILTGVKGDPLPTKFSLDQNYPNPFNPTTTIHYGLPRDAFITLAVYNVLGQHVAQLVQGQVQAGYHDVEFRADGLTSGLYFYRLDAGSFTSVKKFLLVK